MPEYITDHEEPLQLGGIDHLLKVGEVLTDIKDVLTPEQKKKLQEKRNSLTEGDKELNNIYRLYMDLATVSNEELQKRRYD